MITMMLLDIAMAQVGKEKVDSKKNDDVEHAISTPSLSTITRWLCLITSLLCKRAFRHSVTLCLGNFVSLTIVGMFLCVHCVNFR